MSELFNGLENKNREPGKAEKDLAMLFEQSLVKLPDPPPLETAWADLRVRMAAADLAAPVRRKSWLQFWMRPAFGAMAVLILVAVSWYAMQNDVPEIIAVERGVNYRVVGLNDQSKVTIKSDSNLTLDPGFNKGHRHVMLEGEAYFEIEKGAQPFVITAGNSQIKVVGTKFTVYARDGLVRLDVSEGIVEFSSRKAGKNSVVRVTAGESSEAMGDDRPQPPKPNDLKNKQPEWLKDLFTFDDVPLSEICKALERRFDVKIKIEDPSLGQLELKGTLSTESLEDTMKALVVMAECRYHKNADGAYVLR